MKFKLDYNVLTFPCLYIILGRISASCSTAVFPVVHHFPQKKAIITQYLERTLYSDAVFWSHEKRRHVVKLYFTGLLSESVEPVHHFAQK